VARADVRRACTSLGLADGGGAIHAQALHDAFAQCGRDGEGCKGGEGSKSSEGDEAAQGEQLGFEQFCEIVEPLYDASSHACHRAFELFDQDGDGYVSKADLAALFEKLELKNGRRKGNGKPGPTLDQIFALADTDRDGKIDFEDFCAMLGASGGGCAATSASARTPPRLLDAKAPRSEA
jgi:Ca2+-binding EF-hand superfamily protein